jgi:hypothetical protein
MITLASIIGGYAVYHTVGTEQTLVGTLEGEYHLPTMQVYKYVFDGTEYIKQYLGDMQRTQAFKMFKALKDCE